MVLNDGFSQGGVSLHKDSIVGAQYRLNAKPDYRVLGATAVGRRIQHRRREPLQSRGRVRGLLVRRERHS
jgi:hypothetical protein